MPWQLGWTLCVVLLININININNVWRGELFLVPASLMVVLNMSIIHNLKMHIAGRWAKFLRSPRNKTIISGSQQANVSVCQNKCGAHFLSCKGETLVFITRLRDDLDPGSDD